LQQQQQQQRRGVLLVLSDLAHEAWQLRYAAADLTSKHLRATVAHTDYQYQS
jgi:hypothetical protein